MHNTVNFENLSPINFLKHSVKAFPNEIAIKQGDLLLTYKQFAYSSLLISQLIKKHDIHIGDRICVFAHNSSQTLLLHYGIILSGAIIVPINRMFSISMLQALLQESGAKILFTDELELKIENSICIFNIEELFATNMRLAPLADQSDLQTLDDFQCLNELDIISINYTSGSSGQPKGVMASHRSSYLNALGQYIHAKLDRNSRYLWTLPLFHCNGWGFSWAVTAAGGMHVFIESLDENLIISSILNDDITHFCAAPTVLKKIQRAKQFASLKDSCLQNIFTAGSSPCLEMIKCYEDMGVNITHVYGLTETYGPNSSALQPRQSSLIDKEQAVSLKKAQGVPMIHGAQMKVVLPDFKEVPWDGQTIGEVIMRGNNIMMGYYRQPSQTNQVFKNGWFCSGDLAVVLANGHIELRDRLDDMINSGGEKIPSILVEEVLERFPYVLKAAVVAEPDKYWGELVHAVIELEQEASDGLEKLLLEHCQKLLPKIMIPKKFTFNKVLISNTGKKQKHLIKKLLFQN